MSSCHWLASLALAYTYALAGAVAIGEARAEGGQAAMVIDANTGAVLHDQSGDEQRHPASLTKMMTLYLVFEQVELGRLTYATRIKMSQEAAAAAPSKLDLDPGEEITLIDAVKAVITKSANDVAVALAEHIAGSEGRFAELMNQRARQIGMRNTHFRNASGLPDPAQVTTARDMITLGLRLQDDFPRHYQLFQTRAFSHGDSSYRNHNMLLSNFRGTDGIKTGYTRMSGFNLVASVRRDGKHLVGAVFGGASAGARDAHMRLLLMRSFAKASTEKTRKPMLVARVQSPPIPQPVPAVRPKPPPALAAPMPVEVSRGRLAGVPASSADEGLSAARDMPLRPRGVMVPPLAKAVTPAPPEQARPTPSLPWLTPPLAARSAAESRPPVSPNREPASRPAAGPPPVVAVNSRIVSEATSQALAPPTAGPSTLQAQAARLALAGPQGSRPVPMPVAVQRSASTIATAPAVTQSAVGVSGLEIQVGAFPTSAEAERQIALVRGKAASLVQDRRPLVVPVKKEGRQLYRARFTGFEAKSAAATCMELRRLAVDCFVMRAE